jgi:CBS domain-containing protein
VGLEKLFCHRATHEVQRSCVEWAGCRETGFHRRYYSDAETWASCRRVANVSPRDLTGRQITLEDIMRPAVSVRHDAPAREALQVMLDDNVPGVPVVDAKGYLVGFVDDKRLLTSALPSSITVVDCLPGILEGRDSWIRYDRAAADRPVEELMSKEFPWVDILQSEVVAAHMMVRDNVPYVVVTEAGKVAGLVTRIALTHIQHRE